MKNKEYTINPERCDLDSFIWMTYRYAIGRKSIACASKPADIVNLLHQIPGYLSVERKKFMARDIRGCISDSLRFHRGMYVEGFCSSTDAITELYKEFARNAGEASDPNFFKEHTFTVDFYNEKIYIEDKPVENPVWDLWSVMDYAPWIRLAEWLDPRHMVTLMDGGTKKSICWPSISQNKAGVVVPVIKYVDWDQYDKNPEHDIYFDPEQIVTVTKI